MCALLFSLAFTILFLLTTVVKAAPTGNVQLLEETDSSWLDILRRQVDGYKNDPAAGSYLDKTAIVVIIVACIGVLGLVGLLIYCGRARRFPQASRK